VEKAVNILALRGPKQILLVVFTAILLSSINLNALAQKTDRSDDSLLENKSIGEQIEVMIQLVEKYRYNEPQKAEDYARKAIKLSEDTGTKRIGISLTLRKTKLRDLVKLIKSI